MQSPASPYGTGREPGVKTGQAVDDFLGTSPAEATWEARRLSRPIGNDGKGGFSAQQRRKTRTNGLLISPDVAMSYWGVRAIF
jgi:hypothetical protein